MVASGYIRRFIGISRNCPVIFAGAAEFAAGDHAGELLDEEAALAAAAQAEFADELLVAGALIGGTGDSIEQIAV